MSEGIQVAGSSEEDLRKQAIHSLEKKARFRQSLIAYILVNLFLVGIWAVSGADYFWPIWVIAGWGLGLAIQAYDTYGRKSTVNEDEIAQEMGKIRGG